MSVCVNLNVKIQVYASAMFLVLSLHFNIDFLRFLAMCSEDRETSKMKRLESSLRI